MPSIVYRENGVTYLPAPAKWCPQKQLLLGRIFNTSSSVLFRLHHTRQYIDANHIYSLTIQIYLNKFPCENEMITESNSSAIQRFFQVSVTRIIIIQVEDFKPICCSPLSNFSPKLRAPNSFVRKHRKFYRLARRGFPHFTILVGVREKSPDLYSQQEAKLKVIVLWHGIKAAWAPSTHFQTKRISHSPQSLFI
jgi:hypothetical protein